MNIENLSTSFVCSSYCLTNWKPSLPALDDPMHNTCMLAFNFEYGSTSVHSSEVECRIPSFWTTKLMVIAKEVSGQVHVTNECHQLRSSVMWCDPLCIIRPGFLLFPLFGFQFPLAVMQLYHPSYITPPPLPLQRICVIFLLGTPCSVSSLLMILLVAMHKHCTFPAFHVCHCTTQSITMAYHHNYCAEHLICVPLVMLRFSEWRATPARWLVMTRSCTNSWVTRTAIALLTFRPYLHHRHLLVLQWWPQAVLCPPRAFQPSSYVVWVAIAHTAKESVVDHTSVTLSVTRHCSTFSRRSQLHINLTTTLPTLSQKNSVECRVLSGWWMRWDPTCRLLLENYSLHLKTSSGQL